MLLITFAGFSLVLVGWRHWFNQTRIAAHPQRNLLIWQGRIIDELMPIITQGHANSYTLVGH